MRKGYSINFVWLVIAMFFILGCKGREKKMNNDENQNIKILNGLKLSPLVDSVFKEYIKEVPGAFAYAIFLDKKSEGMSEFMITIAPFEKKVSNVYESGATSYFLLNDSVPVFIYTGLEDFVQCDSPLFKKAKEFPPDIKPSGEFKYMDHIYWKFDFSRSWSYVRFRDTSYVVKENNAPFFSIRLLPTKVFFAPPGQKIK